MSDPKPPSGSLNFSRSDPEQKYTAAYYQAIGQFLDWCQRAGFSNLEDIEPIHVAAYIESHKGSAATIKQHMAAIRMMFSWLTEKGIFAIDPAREVKTPKFSRTEGKTPAFSTEEVQKVLSSSIPVTSSAFGIKHFLLLWLIRLPGSVPS